MINHEQDNEFENVLELLSEQGFDGMREAMETPLNETMKLQRSVHLNAAPHQRTEDRKGYANSFKDKQVHTRLGKLSLSVPQTRGTDFYPGAPYSRQYPGNAASFICNRMRRNTSTARQ